MICPKCGFEQPEGPECLHCGIVIAKYRGPVAQAEPPPLPELAFTAPPAETPPSGAPPSFLSAADPVPPPPPPPEAPAVAGTLYEGPAAPRPSWGPPRPAIPLRPFESGALLGETFSIYFSNFLPFVMLTVLAFSPVLAAALLTPAAGGSARFLRVVVQLGSVLCSPLATAALTFGVVQQMRRREASFSDCLRVGLSSLFSVLFVAILQGLAVFAGTLLCVVPGIIAAVMLAVAVPAAVEERRGATHALSRSSRLTDGYRWQVFGVLFVLGLLNIALALLMIPLMGGLEGAQSMSQNPTPTYIVMSQLLSLVPTGLSATASAVMYYRLRSLKEGIDVEEIASVFD